MIVLKDLEDFCIELLSLGDVWGQEDNLAFFNDYIGLDGVHNIIIKI
jgi:hypothetical protein